VVNILNGSYVDWHSVPDPVTGKLVAASSVPITVYNRETGSGPWIQANIYFLGYLCNPGAGALFDSQPDLWSTFELLTVANTVAGAITYSVVDGTLPSGRYPNLVFATLNGIQPSNLAAATGEYEDWFEAKFVKSANFSNFTGNTQSLANYIVSMLPALTTGPEGLADNVIPFVANNTPAVPLNSRATGITIYVNPYTRNGNSCALPAEQN